MQFLHTGFAWSVRKHTLHLQPLYLDFFSFLQTVQTVMKRFFDIGLPPSAVSEHSLLLSGHILIANFSTTTFYERVPSRVPMQYHSETSITQLHGWY
jgi:hypothetical protein